MRVAFLGNRFLNPDNPRSWSGSPYFMRRALESAGLELITILTEDESGRPARWLRYAYWRFLRRKRYLIHSEPELLKAQARRIDAALASHRVDAILSPSTWALAYLRGNVPAVLWTDACFAGVVGFYESFSNLAPPSLNAGHMVERKALQRCTRAVFSSDWAARGAEAHYGLDPIKSDVVPFGANLLEPPSPSEVAASIQARGRSPCRLLLVGVDWQRKGADTAVCIHEELAASDVDSRLTIVGCRPPPGTSLPTGVEVIPFLSKASAEDRRRLADLYARSHFYVMPTRAETYGIVFAEASAYGVPSLAPDIGGLATVIREGSNGYLFPPDAAPEAYAARIRALMRDPEAYERLARRAAEDAAQRLAWPVAGRRVAEILQDAVSRHSPPLPITT